MIPVAHGGNGAAFKADVEGAYASDIGAEQFALMNPGGREALVWMQNAEPIGLYCADETDGETLRACEQMMQSLLAYEPARPRSWRRSPPIGRPTRPDRVDLHAARRRHLPQRRHAGRQRCRALLRRAVGCVPPAPRWARWHFTYFSSLFGGLLNAPPAE
jgi:peptide/nickel transport system substrate-binding protein